MLDSYGIVNLLCYVCCDAVAVLFNPPDTLSKPENSSATDQECLAVRDGPTIKRTLSDNFIYDSGRLFGAVVRFV